MGSGRGSSLKENALYRLALFRALLTVVLTLADVITDITVCKTFWDQGQKVWFGFSVAFLFLGAVMEGLISVVYSFDEGRNRNPFKTLTKFFTTVLRALLMLELWEGIRGVLTGGKHSVSRHARSIERFKRFEMIFESIPQSIVQSYIIALQFTTATGDSGRIIPSTNQAVSLLLSTASVAFGVASSRWKVDFTTGAIVTEVNDDGSAAAGQGVVKGKRKAMKGGILFMLISFLWTFSEVITRTASLAIFAVGYKGIAVIVLAIELAVRIILVRLLNSRVKGSWFSLAPWGAAMLRGLNQMLSNEATVKSPSNKWSDYIFSVFTVMATFALHAVYIILPVINPKYPSIRPPNIGIVPRPIASDVCWKTEYETKGGIPTLFEDITDPACVNKYPAALIVSSLAFTVGALFFYLLFQSCSVRYFCNATKHKKEAEMAAAAAGRDAAAAGAAAEASTGEVDIQDEVDTPPAQEMELPVTSPQTSDANPVAQPPADGVWVGQNKD